MFILNDVKYNFYIYRQNFVIVSVSHLIICTFQALVPNYDSLDYQTILLLNNN